MEDKVVLGAVIVIVVSIALLFIGGAIAGGNKDKKK